MPQVRVEGPTVLSVELAMEGIAQFSALTNEIKNRF